MSNILDELGIDTKPVISTPETDDELLSMLMEETKYRSENSETAEIPEYEYPDFAPETSEHIQAHNMDEHTNALDMEDSVTAAGLALSALPIETIVETVDITLTNAMIMGLHIDPNSEQCQDLETDAKDLKALQKATKQYLDSQEIKISPLVALLITVSMVYGKKFFFAKRLQKIERKATRLENENQELKNENMQYRSYIDELQKDVPQSKPMQANDPVNDNLILNSAPKQRKKSDKCVSTKSI